MKFNFILLTKSRLFKYVFIRYFSYGLQFLNTFLLSKYLGLSGYGTYSFILLLFSYFLYVNLGLNNSLNTILSIKKNNINFASKLWSAAFSGVWIVVLLFFCVVNLYLLLDNSLIDKYLDNIQFLYVSVIAVFSNINLMYVSLFRIYNKYTQINIQQTLPNLFVFIIVLIFNTKLSVNYILYVMLLANIVSFIVFIKTNDLKTAFNIKLSVLKVLFKKGIALVLYGFSYQFIFMSSLTIASIYYSKELFGIYSLASVISNALLMVTASFMFILYPKFINKFSRCNNEETLGFLFLIKNTYVIGVNLILYLTLPLIVVASMFYPEYNELFNLFKLLLISQLLLNEITGELQYLIVKNNERSIVFYGFLVSLFILLSNILVSWLNFELTSLPMLVVLGVLIYVYFIIRQFHNTLTGRSKYDDILKYIKIYDFIPLLVLFVSVLVDTNGVFILLPLIVFLFLNWKRIRNLYSIVSSYLLTDNLFKN